MIMKCVQREGRVGEKLDTFHKWVVFALGSSVLFEINRTLFSKKISRRLFFFFALALREEYGNYIWYNFWGTKLRGRLSWGLKEKLEHVDIAELGIKWLKLPFLDGPGGLIFFFFFKPTFYSNNGWGGAAEAKALVNQLESRTLSDWFWNTVNWLHQPLSVLLFVSAVVVGSPLLTQRRGLAGFATIFDVVLSFQQFPF